jgi:hypothetical protein
VKDIRNWRHICVDAQRMFADETPWYVPWMARVLPALEELSERHAERTIFTPYSPASFHRRASTMASVAGKTTTVNGG